MAAHPGLGTVAAGPGIEHGCSPPWLQVHCSLALACSQPIASTLCHRNGLPRRVNPGRSWRASLLQSLTTLAEPDYRRPPPSESSPLAVGSGLQKGVAPRPNSVPAIGTVRPHLARTGKQTASDSNDEREPTTSAGVVPVVADVNVSATDDLLFEDALQTRK